MRHYLRKHFLSHRDNIKFIYFILLTFCLLALALINNRKNLNFNLPFNNQIIDSQIEYQHTEQTLNNNNSQYNKI